jgi:hypothetical protein
MLPFERPSIVARWLFGWLVVKWPDGLRGVFVSWDAALLCLVGSDTLRIRWSQK